MAEHHAMPVSDNDYPEHEKTYQLFLWLTKWGTVATVILVMFIGSMTSLLPWALTGLVSVAGVVAAAKM